MRRLGAFGRDKKGATAVEFGLVLLPFMAIVCAIFEVGYVQFEADMLKTSIGTATRQMMTGQTQTGGIATSAAFLNKYLCQPTGHRTLPLNFDCTKLVVDVRSAASFASGDRSKSIYKDGTAHFCPGAPGSIVVVRVTYPLGAIMPMSLFSRSVGVVSDVPGNAGNYHILMGTALFRTENYAGNYTPGAGC